MVGIDVETGKIFDPLGLAAKATDQGLYNYRQVRWSAIGLIARLDWLAACWSGWSHPFDYSDD
jgi:hypothetical protein